MAELRTKYEFAAPVRCLLMHNDRMQQHGINCVGEKPNQHSHNQVSLFVRRMLLRGLNTRHEHLRTFDATFIWYNSQEAIGTRGILNRFTEASMMWSNLHPRVFCLEPVSFASSAMRFASAYAAFRFSLSSCVSNLTIVHYLF